MAGGLTPHGTIPTNFKWVLILLKEAAIPLNKLPSWDSSLAARADLLTQFRSLSGQMLAGSREALLKSAKETVSEPIAKEVLQLRQQVEALQANDQAQRDAALTEHLKKVRSHIDLLSKKDYAGKLSALGQVVDGVVLFIPVEGALSMALERDPQLLEYAFSKTIILTFPTSPLAILKGLAMTIQQAEIAKNIDEIQAQAVELHKRFSTFIDKFNDIGRDITRLNKSFNAAVGSAQSLRLPYQARSNRKPCLVQAVSSSKVWPRSRSCAKSTGSRGFPSSKSLSSVLTWRQKAFNHRHHPWRASARRSWWRC